MSDYSYKTYPIRTQQIYTQGPPKIFNNTYTYQSEGPKFGVTKSSCMVQPVQSNIINKVGSFYGGSNNRSGC